MRKSLIGALGAAFLLAPAAVAIAQIPEPVVTTSGKFSPTKAGTKSKPKGGTFKFSAINSKESLSTVASIRLDLPSEIKLSGKNLKTCSAETLEGPKGSAGCAKASKLGQGVAYAFLIDAGQPAPDCVATKGEAAGCITFKNEFFVGGNNKLNVWLTETGDLNINPELLVGTISKGGSRLDIAIPPQLQSPVPTVYAALAQLDGSWKGSAKKGGKTYNFVSSTGCKTGKWTTKTTLFYTNNSIAPFVESKTAEYVQNCRK